MRRIRDQRTGRIIAWPVGDPQPIRWSAPGSSSIIPGGGGGGATPGGFVDITPLPVGAFPTAFFTTGTDLSFADLYRDSTLMRRVAAFTGAGNEVIVTGSGFQTSSPVTASTWLFARVWPAAGAFMDVSPSPLAALPSNQWNAGVPLGMADVLLDSSVMRKVAAFSGGGNEIIVTGSTFQTSSPVSGSAWLFARAWGAGFVDVIPSPTAALPSTTWDAGTPLTKADVVLNSSLMRRVGGFSGAGNEVIVSGTGFTASAPIAASDWLYVRVWP